MFIFRIRTPACPALKRIHSVQGKTSKPHGYTVLLIPLYRVDIIFKEIFLNKEAFLDCKLENIKKVINSLSTSPL